MNDTFMKEKADSASFDFYGASYGHFNVGELAL